MDLHTKFKRGDLVTWIYSQPEIPYLVSDEIHDAFVDVGIVVAVELWEAAADKKEILEVYFAKAGSSWCHPRSLKLLSRS